jgi:archaellum biogenesis ATPase FlaH
MAKINDDLDLMLKNFVVRNVKDDYISTGNLILDKFLSGSDLYDNSSGGFIRGKLYSFTGDSGVGKSTLMMYFSSIFCRDGYKVLYVDTENGINENILVGYGLDKYFINDLKDYKKDCGNFLVLSNVTFSDFVDILKKMYENDYYYDIIIIDSLKNLKSKYLYNIDDIEQLPIGHEARIMENFLPFMSNFCSKNNVLGIFVNQIRVSMKNMIAVSGEVRVNSFLYNMDFRFMLKEVKNGEIVSEIITNKGDKNVKKIGAWVRFEVMKGRGIKYKYLDIPLIYGKGISYVYLLYAYLVNSGLLEEVKGNKIMDLSKLSGIIEDVDMKVKGYEIFNVIKNNVERIEKYLLDNKIIYIEIEKD